MKKDMKYRALIFPLLLVPNFLFVISSATATDCALSGLHTGKVWNVKSGRDYCAPSHGDNYTCNMNLSTNFSQQPFEYTCLNHKLDDKLKNSTDSTISEPHVSASKRYLLKNCVTWACVGNNPPQISYTATKSTMTCETSEGQPGQWERVGDSTFECKPVSS